MVLGCLAFVIAICGVLPMKSIEEVVLCIFKYYVGIVPEVVPQVLRGHEDKTQL